MSGEQINKLEKAFKFQALNEYGKLIKILDFATKLYR